jgi:hypothetical protein
MPAAAHGETRQRLALKVCQDQWTFLVICCRIGRTFNWGRDRNHNANARFGLVRSNMCAGASRPRQTKHADRSIAPEEMASGDV